MLQLREAGIKLQYLFGIESTVFSIDKKREIGIKSVLWMESCFRRLGYVLDATGLLFDLAD